jgi:hypothetical protein
MKVGSFTRYHYIENGSNVKSSSGIALNKNCDNDTLLTGPPNNASINVIHKSV